MSAVTLASETYPVRSRALGALGVYVALTACVNSWHLVTGSGSIAFLGAQVLLLAAVVVSLQATQRTWIVIGDWLPLIALPVLYWGLPWSMFVRGQMFDGTVQGWDRALFGTDPARTTAGAFPWWPVSELLHLAYLLYYAIIYLPPLVLYVSVQRRGFHETVFAFTVTMVTAFAAFSVFPVEGPRFVWPAPAGVPEGPVRSIVLFLLENGSTRGTAFPSSHVAIALVMSLSALRWKPALGKGVALTTVALSIGAVYGGFHYASDILAGAALGVAGWSVANGVEVREPSEPK